MFFEARLADLQTVTDIVHQTITACYSKWYSEQVVSFFLQHHSKEVIQQDLQTANVYLMESDGYLVGTGTIRDELIQRVFILPQYQGCRFGVELMQCLEDGLAVNKILTAAVNAHEHSKDWYAHLGYTFVSGHQVNVNEELLPYYRMEKQVQPMQTNLDHGLMF